MYWATQVDQKHACGNIPSTSAKAVLMLCLGLYFIFILVYALSLSWFTLSLEGQMIRCKVCWDKVSPSKMFKNMRTIKMSFYQCGVLWTLLI